MPGEDRGSGSRAVPDRRETRGARRGRQDGRDVHAPLLAHGTAVDVDAGQPQHQGVHRLDRAVGRSGGLGQDLPAARELDLPGAVGEEAEVTDADEAVGDDMEEEAADELRRLQLHHLHAIPVGVVLPTESDTTVLEAEDALVGEGHAVGIAAQVLEDLLGAGEGAFGVHDPVRLPKLAEPLSEGAGVGEGGSRSGEDELPSVERAPSGARAPPVTTQWRWRC